MALCVSQSDQPVDLWWIWMIACLSVCQALLTVVDGSGLCGAEVHLAVHVLSARVGGVGVAHATALAVALAVAGLRELITEGQERREGGGE